MKPEMYSTLPQAKVTSKPNLSINLKTECIMKKEGWKTVLQILASIITAILTTQGTTSCMGVCNSRVRRCTRKKNDSGESQSVARPILILKLLLQKALLIKVKSFIKCLNRFKFEHIDTKNIVHNVYLCLKSRQENVDKTTKSRP